MTDLIVNVNALNPRIHRRVIAVQYQSIDPVCSFSLVQDDATYGLTADAFQRIPGNQYTSKSTKTLLVLAFAVSS